MANDATLAPARANAAPARPEDNPEPIFYKDPAKPKVEWTPPPNWPNSGSPTLITLFLRPTKGEAFKGKWSEAVEAARLEHPRRYPIGSEALCHSDTREPFVWFTPNSGYQFFAFKEVAIHFDPENCPAYGESGTTIIEAINKAARKLGAHVVDGLGKRLRRKEMDMLAQHIQDTLVRRQYEAEAARTSWPDKHTKRVQRELSFQFRETKHGPRGGYVSGSGRTVFFDAPKLPYEAGRALGIRMALEHIKYLETHSYSDGHLMATIESAFEMYTEDRESPKRLTRGNVAAGYLFIMMRLVKIGAKGVNLKWVQQQVEYREQEAEMEAKIHAAESKKLTARLKAAREAKRSGGAA
ncbi:hypothetical protein [Xenophilus sp. Marseille-Q4582]|uniref:hypothetical protein n=1 Tax=Xenophilus sp. Marseille-Q4582 TaxID=2866600 RepID=UPI001CE3F929|nr:hypothetical protein [Xenophilus sp. Marseille-Q4582]